MKRVLIGLAFLGLVTAGASEAQTRTHFGFHFGVSNAPPPPRLYYRYEPQVVRLPGSSVYVVDPEANDYDIFHSGNYWYATRDGYWYRARSYRGPFVVVDVRSVPRAIFRAPPRYWRHHPHGGPPGFARAERRYDWGRHRRVHLRDRDQWRGRYEWDSSRDRERFRDRDRDRRSYYYDD
jgi:hypothetical protein